MSETETPDFEDRLRSFAAPAFPSVRDSQRLVLASYARDHVGTADLGIEMPTGEGKTLVALLIADWFLEQGRSVAYLTGTRHLADQVKEEAEKLGLEAVRFAARDYGEITEDQQTYYQAWFNNARRLHQLVRELEALSLRAFEQAEETSRR